MLTNIKVRRGGGQKKKVFSRYNFSIIRPARRNICKYDRMSALVGRLEPSYRYIAK